MIKAKKIEMQKNPKMTCNLNWRNQLYVGWRALQVWRLQVLRSSSAQRGIFPPDAEAGVSECTRACGVSASV